MSTSRGQGSVWLLLAGLVCACEPTAWERTRAHRSGERSEDEAPPARDDSDEATEPTREAPTDDAPAASAPPPPSVSAPAAVPSATPDVPAAAEPAAPVVDAATPVDPPTPMTAPGLRLRGSLRVALELPLGIALRVRLSALLESGALRELASGELDATGAFDLVLGAELEPGLLVAELLDAEGTRLGAVWGANRGTVDESLNLPVLDLQTWLESEVLLGSLACGDDSRHSATAMTLLLDVTTWMDPTLRAALIQALERGASRELAVTALARATVAGAQARAEVLSQAGVALGPTQTRVQRAVLEQLAVERSQARTTADDSLETEHAALRRALDTSLRMAGVLDPALRTRAHVAASLAFGASMRGGFDPQSPLSEALFPALRSAALLEAAVGSDAVLELLNAAGASPESRASAELAAAAFRSDVASATSMASLTQAREKFSAALFGRPSATSGGLLGGVLGGTLGLVGGLLNNVLTTLQQLTTQLDAALALDLAAFRETGGCGDSDGAERRDAASGRLSRTLASFSDEVRRASQSSAGDAATRAASETLARALTSTQLLLRQSH